MALKNPAVNKKALLENCFGTRGSTDSSFSRIFYELHRCDEKIACHFLSELLRQCMAYPEYVNLLSSEVQEAEGIAYGFNRLVAQCCGNCNQNRTELCREKAASLMRDWICNNTHSIELHHPEIHKTLVDTELIMRNEQRQYVKRDRILLGVQGEVVCFKNSTNKGVIRNIGPSFALFETTTESAVSVRGKLGDLHFKIQNVPIKKKIQKATLYEEFRKNNNHKRSLVALEFAEEMSSQYIDLCRDQFKLLAT